MRASIPPWVKPPTVTFRPSQLASAALQTLVEAGIGSAPVLNHEDNLLGVMFRGGGRPWPSDQLASVAEVMQREGPAISPSSSLERVRALFEAHPDDLIPVVDENNLLLGVIYREDVFQSGNVAVTHRKTPSW
jgi:CBS domain-containing protein